MRHLLSQWSGGTLAANTLAADRVDSTEPPSLSSGMRQAIRRTPFVLGYQPKVDLRTGAIVGVEAAVCRKHADRGLVPSATLMGLARKYGVLAAARRGVQLEAFRQAHAWTAAGLPLRRIAIKVSAQELQAGDFLARLRAALGETGLAAQFLELELTEDFLVNRPDACKILQAIKRLGVHLVLGRFGTGRLDLAELRRFPLDTLKLDKSFVGCLTSAPLGASVIVSSVSAVIGMGSRLRMRVAADGVENRSQAAFLAERDCCEAQGRFFNQPIDAADVGLLLRGDSLQTAGLQI